MIESQFFSLPEMIAINAMNRPNAIAWQTVDESVTWSEFDLMVNRSANALIAAGVVRGEPVALLIDSSVYSWTHFFGTLRAGAVATPLNTMLPPSAIASLLTDSGASHLVVSSGWNALAIDTINLIKNLQRQPLILRQGGFLPGSQNLEDLSQAAPLTAPNVALASTDPANIIYSSGTTGIPKGIVHTHGARAATALCFATTFRCSATTRTLLTTPPHTNGSFMVVLPTIVVGGTVYISGGFQADRYLDETRDFRPTLAFMVPTMAQVLVDHPRARDIDWSCCDFIVTAGAPMSAELKRRTREMTKDRLGELWGFTEGVATIIQPHEMESHPDSVGRAVNQCDVRVIADDDSEVENGVVGELVGRSAWMMSGYHNRPQATNDVIWRAPDGRIYLRTGDLGVKDADGWISIKGRKKDMLISGGLNIYPSDIEAVAMTQQNIHDCAVVGVPHKKWGETPVAFVIPKPGANIDSSALKGWLNEQLGRHQRVHDVVVTPEFPRNTLGKVVKHELAKSYGPVQ
ncbi:MAG: class I adenylate-forming enzyme family protein [Pseudomonadota bacterium]